MLDFLRAKKYVDNKVHIAYHMPSALDGNEGDLWLKMKSLYDFEADTIGALPDGWSLQFGSGFTVQSIDTTQAVKSKRGDITRSVLRCDDIGANIIDSDIKVDVYITASDAIPGIAARASGSTGVENCYCARLQKNASFPRLEIFKYVNGVPGLLVNTAKLTIDLNKWYTIRFKVEGDNLYAKYWEKIGVEPQAWALTAVDTSLTSGYVGIFDAYPGTCYVDNWEIL